MILDSNNPRTGAPVIIRQLGPASPVRFVGQEFDPHFALWFWEAIASRMPAQRTCLRYRRSIGVGVVALPPAAAERGQ